MGDPLQTGRELNRIHRPKFPTVLFGITVILTLVGIVMQGILLSHMEMVGAENYLRNTILYNGIGLLLILGLLYETGTFQLWADGAFIAAGLAGGMLGTHIWSGSYHDRYEAVYLLWMFFPVLYALLLYRMRTLSWKVILILDAVYLAAVLLLSKDITCSAGMMEAFLLSIVILFLAIKRGILPGKRDYSIWRRMDYRMGKGETGYIASNIQQEQHGFSLLGGERSVRHYFYLRSK